MKNTNNISNEKRVKEVIFEFITKLFFERDYNEASKLLSRDIRFVDLDGNYIDSKDGNIFSTNKDFFDRIPKYTTHGLIIYNAKDITDLLYECTVNLTDLISTAPTSDYDLDNIKLHILVRINAENEVMIIKVSHSPFTSNSYITNYSAVGYPNEDRFNKEILKNIIDSYPYPIFWKDLEGRYLGFNKAFLEKRHFNNSKNIYGKKDFEIFPETNRNKQQFVESDNLVFKNGRTTVGYYNEDNAYDSNSYIQYIKTPLFQNNKMVGVIGYTSDLTQLKELEIKYKNTQQHLDYVLNNTNIGYFLKDKDLKFIKVNQYFADLIGYEIKDLLNKNDKEIDLPFTNALIFDREKQILTNKKTIEFKSIISNSDEIKRTISVTEGPIFENKSDVVGLFGLVEDISDSQNQHTFLQQQYRKAIEYLKTENFISYWRVDLEENSILEFSTAKNTIDKFTTISENLIKNLEEKVMFEDKKKEFSEFFAVENLKAKFDTEKEFTFEYFGKSIEQDKHLNFFVRTKFIKNPINNHREVIHYSYDQTETVKKDELYSNIVQKQYDFVAKLYVKFNLALIISENSNDYNFSKLVSNNECSLDKFLVNIFESFILEGKDILDFINDVQGDLKSNNTVLYGFDTKSKKRKAITIEVVNQKKQIYYIFSSDITEITKKDNRIKKELEEAAKNAEKANEIKSDFLARMSHDMRTPLNGIIGLAEFGAEEDNIDILKDYLSKINFSSKYLLTLVNDVLDMQSISKGKLKLKKVPVSLKGSMNDLVQLVKQRAIEKNIQIKVNIPNIDETYAFLDSMRLRQAIVNILSNAIKYTQKGGTVTFSSQLKSLSNELSDLIITVKDNGVGMSKEFQKHMYESFTSENNELSIQEGGTGLGLSITSSLVHLMGGTIECESELSIGTTFTINVPISIIDSKKYIELMNNSNFSHISNKLRAKNVLICEDNSINRLVLNKILTDEGAILTFANDGLEGVKQAKLNNFDLILMDIRMPVMDGLEAAKNIREFNLEVPIIALSANAYDDDTYKSIAAGMNAHLAKPIDRNELIYTINLYL